MSRPILKFAVALFLLAAAVLLWCNRWEILGWASEILGRLIGGCGSPGGLEPVA